jgi:mono/diheme cytochrome c family protein
MRRVLIILCAMTLCALTLLTSGCSRKSKQPAPLKATATGAAIVESSGDKQIGYIGMPLDQPVVVQVNDASGAAVAGAAVYFRGPSGVSFAPAAALADSSGQVTTTVSFGQQAGRYKLVASTRDASGKNVELTLDEIALGYQQTVGAQLNAQYCIRCHDPESTPQRVSNMDNLSVKPHAFTEGDTLNKMSDADLVAIISHGGPALNKSAEMPPWGYTLSNSDIAALASYIRAVADPPYEAGGLVYAQK